MISGSLFDLSIARIIMLNMAIRKLPTMNTIKECCMFSINLQMKLAARITVA